MSKKDSPYMMASPDIYPILKANARKNRGEMTLAESLCGIVLRLRYQIIISADSTLSGII